VVADHNGMKHPQISSESAGEALERLLTAIREDHDSRH
jgi:hypothetical protein